MTRFVPFACVVLIVAAMFTFAPDATAQGDKQTLMREHFTKAIKAMDAGKYEEASREFGEVLKLDPSSADALELRNLADARFFVQAMTKGSPEMRASAEKLLERAAQAEKERVTDTNRIQAMVKDLLGPFESRTKAYIGLTSAGRYAVPQLLEKLTNTADPHYKDYRVGCTVALLRIGEEAVIPLCTALRTQDAHLRQDICFVLGQIGDPRAVPYLIGAAKTDADENVREVAGKSLARLARYIAIPDVPPHVALFRYARLYYENDPSVRRPSKYGHCIWNWSTESQEETRKEKGLVMQPVPGFLYNVSMARRVATEALRSQPGYEPTLPLLISAYHKEITLIQRRLELSKTDAGMALSELEGSQLLARLAKAEKVLLTLRSAGERHFYRALTIQLDDNEPQLAVGVIEDLAVVASSQLNVYPSLPELSEPLRPVVVEPQPAVVEAKEPAPAEAEKPVAAPAAGAGVMKPAEGTIRRRVRAAGLFGLAVAKEVEATEPEREPAKAEPTPSAADTLDQLLATARARTMERRLKMADARVAARKEEARTHAETEKPKPLVNSLVRALQNSDKGVRYGAASALARINPVRDFLGSEAVVEILGQAITEKGVSTVLIAAKDGQVANRLSVLARAAGHVVRSAGSTATALLGSRSLPPKDLILLDSGMDETFAELKKDPALAGIPVLVFTQDKDTAVAQQVYPGVPVVSLADTADAIKAEMARVILGRRTPGEGMRLATQYASQGAKALASIPSRGSPFSQHLPKIRPALIAALDSKLPGVRISAVGALGKARIRSLIPRLILICQSEDRAQAERLACIEAIGDMLDPRSSAPAEVVALLERIHRSGNDELRRFANERLSSVSVPPSDLEELINAEEAAESKPAPDEM